MKPAASPAKPEAQAGGPARRKGEKKEVKARHPVKERPAELRDARVRAGRLTGEVEAQRQRIVAWRNKLSHQLEVERKRLWLHPPRSLEMEQALNGLDSLIGELALLETKARDIRTKLGKVKTLNFEVAGEIESIDALGSRFEGLFPRIDAARNYFDHPDQAVRNLGHEEPLSAAGVMLSLMKDVIALANELDSRGKLSGHRKKALLGMERLYGDVSKLERRWEDGTLTRGTVAAAAAAGPISFEFKDDQSAGQMRPLAEEDYKYRYIVMPMRL